MLTFAMPLLSPFRVAPLATFMGILFFIQFMLPEIIDTLPKSTAYSLLNLFVGCWEIVTFIWSDYNLLLLAVLFLRYFRTLLSTYACLFLNKPDGIPEHPTVTSEMVHVIIATIEPSNSDFSRCVMSVLEKRPGWITVVTANQQQTAEARQVLANLPAQKHTSVKVTTGPMANKRRQLAHVLRRLAQNCQENRDVLIVFMDDHVWWPSPSFLSAVIAPFEDPKIGIVGMHKRAERKRGKSFADSLLNFIACLYLERHNFDVCASNAIDGSAFVVSGRTCAVRASIVMEDEFINGFIDERFFFGRYGPLNPDDDNYITRYIIRKGWNIKWQNQIEALMLTSLGVVSGYTKFYGQLQRWARSQWRSNSRAVFADRSIWRRGYVWGGIVLCSTFTSFALFWDPLIVYLWYRSSYIGFTAHHLVFLIVGSKFVKVAPFFYHNPNDILLYPFQVLFTYFHSLIKLWALFTFYDHSWGGRNLAAVGNRVAADNDADDNDDDDHWKGPNNCTSFSPIDSSFSARDFGPQSQPQGGTSGKVDSQPATDFMADVDSKRIGHSYKQPHVQTRFSTSWGSVRTHNKHDTPANVDEGQYSSPGSMNNFSPIPAPRLRRDSMRSGPGTPLLPRPATKQPTVRMKVGNGRSTSENRRSSAGYLGDDELPRGRSLSGDDDSSGLTPDRDRSSHSLHAYDLGLGHPYPKHDISPTRYYPQAPDVPRKTSIVFKKTSPIGYLESVGTKFVYARDFPRGDDCLRTHPDGTYLSVPRGSREDKVRKRCRSPEPSWRPIIPNRPRI